QNDRAHADQAAVFDHAAVQGHRVPDGHVFTKENTVLVFHSMQHAAILNVRVGADADGVYVAAHHSVHPDARVLTQHDIADDLRRLVDIAGGRDGWRNTFVGSDHGSRKNFENSTDGARKVRASGLPLALSRIQSQVRLVLAHRGSARRRTL